MMTMISLPTLLSVYSLSNIILSIKILLFIIFYYSYYSKTLDEASDLVHASIFLNWLPKPFCKGKQFDNIILVIFNFFGETNLMNRFTKIVCFIIFGNYN